MGYASEEISASVRNGSNPFLPTIDPQAQTVLRNAYTSSKVVD